MEAQHNLRRPIPPRRDIFSHVSRILLRVDREPTSQTEVTDLELTVRIDQQVSGFEISVEDIRRVDVLQTAEDLVDEGLEVGVGQRLSGSDDGGQIALHQFWLRHRVSGWVE